jgi:hypothetical protein
MLATFEDFNNVFLACMLPELANVEREVLVNPITGGARTISCWEIDPDDKRIGLYAMFTDPYSCIFSFPGSPDKKKDAKILSYKVLLIKRWLSFDPNLSTRTRKLTIDHLCHKNKCRSPWNPNTTYIGVNSGRNGCGGPGNYFRGMNALSYIMAGSFATGMVPFLLELSNEMLPPRRQIYLSTCMTTK